MTIGANLGSMFTPMGNPQNLYLYGLSGMKLLEFLFLMLPLTAAAALLLALSVVFYSKKGKIKLQMEEKTERPDLVRTAFMCFIPALPSDGKRNTSGRDTSDPYTGSCGGRR